MFRSARDSDFHIWNEKTTKETCPWHSYIYKWCHLILETISEVTVYLQCNAWLHFLVAAEKVGNCCAPSLIWVPEDTAGHLRWSPLRESSLQEKPNDEMQFTAGAFSKPMYAYQNRRLYRMHQHADEHWFWYFVYMRPNWVQISMDLCIKT